MNEALFPAGFEPRTTSGNGLEDLDEPNGVELALLELVTSAGNGDTATNEQSGLGADVIPVDFAGTRQRTD